MKHPFEVGESYRNRDGEYEVIDITDDMMTLEYPSGRTIESSIALQQRIWQNLQIEKEIKKEKKSVAKKQRAPSLPSRKAAFSGFEAADFGQVKGSHWRSRTALGGVLGNHLRDQTHTPFHSWAVPRRIEMHVARPDQYDYRSSQPCVKLFVYAYDELAFGFYIEAPEAETPREEVEKYRHWKRFQDKITGDEAMQNMVLQAMEEHDLQLTDYYQSDAEGTNFGGALGGAFQFRESDLRWRSRSSRQWESVEPAAMFARIGALPGDEWVNLHLFAAVPQPEAIEQEAGIINPILDTLTALIPVYQMTVVN
ncbi:MAG: hypothetical protein KDD92_07770 [Caldilineaceae bacterium]|nr:hypothetical protein [Caldilineaceae bacterium]